MSFKHKSSRERDSNKHLSASVPTLIVSPPLLLRERGQPYLLYIALAHMHVPLAPALPQDATATARRPADGEVYTASLQEMDSLVGAVKSASDDTDKDNNTLIWFTG